MKKVFKIFFGILLCFIMCLAMLGLNQKVFAASVSVSGGSVNEGENITVNFSVTDNVGGFSGNVSYDTDKLEFVSSSVSGTGSYNNGSVALVGGDSFSVTFRAKTSGTAAVSLGNIMLGDGSTVSGSSGKVTIKGSQIVDTPPVSTNQEVPPAENNRSEPAKNVEPTPAPNPQPEPEPEFRKVSETVYATKSINVRSSWSTSSSKVGGLSLNQAVTRTGIGDNGWSRITYNGKEAYVYTSFITTTEPQIEETDAGEVEETVEEVIEEVEEKGGLDESGYDELVANIGTIPEVGTNYNIYAFMGICVIVFGAIKLSFYGKASE